MCGYKLPAGLPLTSSGKWKIWVTQPVQWRKLDTENLERVQGKWHISLSHFPFIHTHTLSLHTYTNKEWMDLEGNPSILSGLSTAFSGQWPFTHPYIRLGGTLESHSLLGPKSPVSWSFAGNCLSRNLDECMRVSFYLPTQTSLVHKIPLPQWHRCQSS